MTVAEACREAEWTRCTGTCPSCPKRTLRWQAGQLLTCNLPEDERQMLAFVLDVNGEGALEEVLLPDLVARIKLRFEWFFLSDGTSRRRAA